MSSQTIFLNENRNKHFYTIFLYLFSESSQGFVKARDIKSSQVKIKREKENQEVGSYNSGTRLGLWREGGAGERAQSLRDLTALGEGQTQF